MSAKGEVRIPGSHRILPLITDATFLLLAAYLLLGYARTLLNSPEPLFFMVRQGFFIFYLTLSLVLFAIRDEAAAYSSRIRDYVYTLLGVGSPLLFQPALSIALVPAELLEVAGSALLLCGFLSLRKSFGLGPENRGIKTTGAYKLIRHPMYSGYILAEAGFFLDNFSLYNLLILTASILFLLLRMRAEERLLQKDRAYKKYSESVRWRLMPLVF